MRLHSGINLQRHIISLAFIGVYHLATIEEYWMNSQRISITSRAINQPDLCFREEVFVC